MPPQRKRESELARPRSRKGGDAAAPEAIKGERRTVTIPREKTDWTPDAKRWFKSLKTSGQADFYQDSDWALAVFLCDEITYYRSSNRRSPEMLKTILSGMEKLLTSEADRLKARVELTNPEPESDPASVLAIADYRTELGA
ncbi:hypothetical protein [Cellulosimicrobium sp. TH-20]|uniref:phage terminase small subunit n=1 Tax=Cellulosimicrobium sp. TH-20 TaxID=1980001 RepID=UPI0011A90436|nr:hypothetical protein [Cellulosimicrobium sp. TH-20]